MAKDPEITEYRGEKMLVTFDGTRCIAAGECVRGLPLVFRKGQKPWAVPDNASVDEVVDVVLRCPSGALKFERLDGGPQEQAPAEMSISVQKNGPYHVRGELPLRDHRGNTITTEYRYSLCRCGRSENKPFCDGTHNKIEPFE